MSASKIDLQATSTNEAITDFETLSHYQIRAQLGEGGFGNVHEAWDSKLCRKVAIKRLKIVAASSSVNPSLPASDLLKEARLAASLQHAAFVKIHAIEEDGDSTAIVMELVPGLTLKQWSKGQPQEANQVIALVRQIAEAMQEAHAAKLIHGDLKPSNLVIEPSGKVRILDFGLAKQMDAQATASVSQLDPQGTIAYMAPELMLGTLPNQQTDIYALGAILYELLNGSRPHAHLSGLALAAAHMQASSDSWSYPGNLPAPLIQLIRDMTASQPEHRLANMQAVVERIAALGGTIKPTDSPALKLSKAKINPSARWAIAALLTTLILGVGGWQLAPYAGTWRSTISSSLTPYSEALELQQGLAALKLFDRPGSLDAADKNFNTVLSHNPNNAAAVAGLSLLYSFRYSNDGQDEVWLQKADASAQQALKLNDQLALSHVARTWVLNSYGKNELALTSIERALVLDPQNVFALFANFDVNKNLGHLDQAKAIAIRGKTLFPQERVFADELGVIQFEQRDYVGAEQSFRLSIKLQPDAVFAYANLSATLARLNRGDEALQVLQQGLQIRPSAYLYTNLGNALFVRGDYLPAATAFEHAVSPNMGNPSDYLGWANLADTLLWIPGRAKEARKAYQKALELLTPRLDRTKNDETLVSRMGLYSARTGNKVQAIELTQRAVALAPKSPDVHFRAGLAYELLGSRKLALDEIAKAKQFGYPSELIEAEPDLIALRRDASFYNRNPL